MKDIVVRASAGLVFIVILLSSIFICKETYFLVLIFFMLQSLKEFNSLIKMESKWIYVSSIGVFLVSISSLYNLLEEIEPVLPMLVFFVPFLIWMVDKENTNTEYIGKFFLTLIYIGMTFSLLAKIPFSNGNESYNPYLIASVFLIIWINDTFAYLVGRTIGKNKLYERISPKKTIEGFVGGLGFTILATVILSNYNKDLTLLEWIILGLITAIFGVIGDLIESLFKRQANIKDSSQLIPGHGGVLDRLDSIIFASPFIYTYLQIIL